MRGGLSPTTHQEGGFPQPLLTGHSQSYSRHLESSDQFRKVKGEKGKQSKTKPTRFWLVEMNPTKSRGFSILIYRPITCFNKRIYLYPFPRESINNIHSTIATLSVLRYHNEYTDTVGQLWYGISCMIHILAKVRYLCMLLAIENVNKVSRQ